MIKRIRIFLPLLISSGFVWSLAMITFFMYRYWEGQGLDIDRIRFDFPLENYPLLRIAIEAFIFGVISESMEILVFRERFKSLASPVLVVIKLAGHLCLFLLYVSLSLLARQYINFQVFAGALEPLRNVFRNGYVYQIIIFFSAIVLLMGMFRQLYHLVGPFNFSSFVLGRYKAPRQEERIFLFLDLNSSTHLAEQLGDMKFSQLLQDCFTDLSDLSYSLRAQTYQYVGDEAVYTWLSSTGFKHTRCLKLFYRFKRRLEKNRKYYLKKYGVMPSFKAALHCGKIVGAEVGKVKTEIAFHGDAINTTSRILDQCHDLGEEFLISQDAQARLGKQRKYEFVEKGPAVLKGKDQQIRLFGVRLLGKA